MARKVGGEEGKKDDESEEVDGRDFEEEVETRIFEWLTWPGQTLAEGRRRGSADDPLEYLLEASMVVIAREGNDDDDDVVMDEGWELGKDAEGK